MNTSTRAFLVFAAMPLAACADMLAIDEVGYASLDEPPADAATAQDSKEYDAGSAETGSSGVGVDAADASREVSDAYTRDAPPMSDVAAPPPSCDGGPVYTHHVGIAGLTWQDCVPASTYDYAEATAACQAYLAHVACPYSASCVFVACANYQIRYESACGASAVWAYQGNVSGHVNASGSCPSASDPGWD
jgi:hypothetical protein